MKTSSKTQFVLDCSITMAWCFEDETMLFTDQILDKLTHTTAVVPSIWPLEVANVLIMAERKKRISSIQVASFIDALHDLPIQVDNISTTRAMGSILELARKTKLTIYNAAYLELAIRNNTPLATLNKELQSGAKKMKVPLL